jgi:AraC family transcriptional regulator
MSDQPASSDAGAARPPAREVQIAARGAFLVAGLRYAGKNEHGEVPSMWDNDFLPRIGELAAHRIGPTAYGVCRTAADLPPGAFEYLAAVEVGSLDGLPPGMVGWKIPAQTYAVLLANNVPDLPATFDYFYSQWALGSAEYAAADGPELEVYPDTFPQDGIIYVYCPVRPK